MTLKELQEILSHEKFDLKNIPVLVELPDGDRAPIGGVDLGNEDDDRPSLIFTLEAVENN